MPGPAAPFIEFDTHGFKELERNFNKAPEHFYGAILTAYRKIGKLLVPAVKAETPVGATRKLRNTTVFQIRGRTEDLQLEIRQSAESGDGFPYGIAVREGTRPHFPPVAALIPWVKAKLGIVDDAEAGKVAFLVARKISRVGTKANPYHDRVLGSNVGEIKRIVREAGVNLVSRLERVR